MPRVFAPVLAAAILFGYGFSLWWMLRHESARTLAALVGLLGIALVLRVTQKNDFPPGLNDDEVEHVRRGVVSLNAGRLFASCAQGPCLLPELFQAPLVKVVGPNRVAIRTYSLITSVLAVLAAFAAARALAMGVAPSLGTAALVACLPWSVYFGRVSIGGEMVFHQLVLLAALGRLVWQAGGVVETVIGSFALALLLYDYACGYAMLGMPLVAAALARGRRRLLCVAIGVLAVVAWQPYLAHTAKDRIPGVGGGYDQALLTNPLGTLEVKTTSALTALTRPIAGDSWLSVRAAGVHPYLVLVLAFAGSLLPIRRGFFLWAGFLGGLSPAVVSWGSGPSTHRMLMAFAFIALAAGSAFDWPRLQRLRNVVMIGCLALAGTQSVRFFFSSEFWNPVTRGTFLPDKTALAEALPLPPHPHLIAMRQLEPFFSFRGLFDSDQEYLSVDNWYPSNKGAIYTFSGEAAELLPFYHALLGPSRVTTYGSAFTVTLEAADWSWLRQHGWAHELRCGGRTQRAVIPTLFHPHLSFGDISCEGEATYAWRARWVGPSVPLRFWFDGTGVMTVRTGEVRYVEQVTTERAIEFPVQCGAPVELTITTPRAVHINCTLAAVTPAGTTLPSWDSVIPEVTADSAGSG
jgi:hypothetical protein